MPPLSTFLSIAVFLRFVVSTGTRRITLRAFAATLGFSYFKAGVVPQVYVD
jgi:hypothetical protein